MPAFCLWKNPEILTARQQAKLADLKRLKRPLLRAYPLTEQLRQIYRLRPGADDPPARAVAVLGAVLPFAAVRQTRRTITAQKAGIVAAVRHGVSNARVEAINTQMRLIARHAFGFHSPEVLISMAVLKLGGLCPLPPGR